MAGEDRESERRGLRGAGRNEWDERGVGGGVAEEDRESEGRGQKRGKVERSKERRRGMRKRMKKGIN